MRFPRTTLRTLALLTLAAAPLSAQQQRFSLDHLRRIVGVSGVQLSPDGRIAVLEVKAAHQHAPSCASLRPENCQRAAGGKKFR